MNTKLEGLRILNTRPKAQAQALTKKIENAGGIAIEFPTIEITKIPSSCLPSIPDLNTVDYAVFISANAVHYWFSDSAQVKISWPQSIQTIAIGTATYKALCQYHIQNIMTPDLPDSEHLLMIKSLGHIRNKTILIFKGDGGRTLIQEELGKRGAKVVPICVYKRSTPNYDSKVPLSLWHENKIDIILLTSEQSIHSIFSLFPKEAHVWLQNKPCVVLSERLAKIASSYGIKNYIVCHPDKIMEGLIQLKAQYDK